MTIVPGKCMLIQMSSDSYDHLLQCFSVLTPLGWKAPDWVKSIGIQLGYDK